MPLSMAYTAKDETSTERNKRNKMLKYAFSSNVSTVYITCNGKTAMCSVMYEIVL